MPTVDLRNLDNEKVGTIELSDEIFGQQWRPDLVADAVRCQLARQRQGSASTKTRGEVSGTGAKPFRQKRTGRARQGTRRAPHHRGGGRAFGPKPRSYQPRLPKKVRHRALCSVLSNQARESKLLVVQSLELEQPRTKQLQQVLERFGLHRCLLVDDKGNQNLRLSARNLPRVAFRPVEGLGLLELLRYETLVISEQGIKRLEGALQK